jgi:hypothetical protein
MISKMLFTKNLNKNYKKILFIISLIIVLYNFLSLEIFSIISYNMNNQVFNMQDRFRLTVITVIFEIVCMIGIVLTNLLRKSVLRRICWYGFYLICFSILFIVLKRTYMDLAFYYLTLVWVESNLFQDYSVLDIDD